MALRWHDIDFDRSTITIRRSLAQVGWDLQFTDVKTRTARRTINIFCQALDALRRHRDAAPLEVGAVRDAREAASGTGDRL